MTPEAIKETAAALVCPILGMVIGATELLNRYRDTVNIVSRRPGVLYMLLNGLVAIVAYGILLSFDWPTGYKGDQVYIVRVVAATFGGMAVLRSSFFNVKIGDETVSVGPNAVVQTLLRTIDRQVDRLRARERVCSAVMFTEDLDFATSVGALPPVVLSLLQSMEPGEASKFAEAMDDLKNSPFSERIKLVLLALQIITLAGEEVTQEAITQLGTNLKPPKE
ncbi:MAG TPA: hypothetical protein VK934_00045 [Fimbriimonas sp.]|nr:hypothetical protein [Fimbriimonas sp.]